MQTEFLLLFPLTWHCRWNVYAYWPFLLSVDSIVLMLDLVILSLSYVPKVINQLIMNKRVIRPYVGLHVVNLLPGDGKNQKSANSTISDETNALITRVERDSPADRAGLKAGDIIIEIDDRKITCIFDCFTAIGLDVGKSLTVKVIYRTAVFWNLLCASNISNLCSFCLQFVHD